MSEPTKACIDMAPRVAEIMGIEPIWGEDTWLPTLEQCLDWLREKGCTLTPYREERLMPGGTEPYVFMEVHEPGYKSHMVHKIQGKMTFREAAYRAVIAVGEGE